MRAQDEARADPDWRGRLTRVTWVRRRVERVAVSSRCFFSAGSVTRSVTAFWTMIPAPRCACTN